jgi:hypothetical protein
VQPSAAGQRVTFHLELRSNRGAIATERTRSRLTALSVQYGAPEELATVGDTSAAHCGSAASLTLLGTVTGLAADEFAMIHASFNALDLVAPPGMDFSLTSLPAGAHDVLATRITRVPGGDVVTRLILRRDVDLPDGATLPAIDFNAPEAFAPVLASVTVAGMAPAGASVNTSLRTANLQSVWSFGTSATNAPATRGYFAIPESRLQSGDLQILTAQANPTTEPQFRTAMLYFRAPVDQTITLGAPISAPDLSVVSTAPALRLRARFPMQSDYDRQTAISFQQGDNTIVGVAMTATYAALHATGYDLSIPDLSPIPGFDTAWALRPSTPVFYVMYRIGGTLGLGANAVPTDGATSRMALTFGDYQPQ